MTHKQPGQFGFTLFEVLVAVALFSLILSIFGVLLHRLAATNDAISRIERSENVDVVRRYLRQNLESIRASSRLDTNGARVLRFEGEPSRIAFVTVAASDRETGGLYETEIWLDSEGRLLLERRPIGWVKGLKLTPEVLLEDLASFTFTYVPCPIEAQSIDHHRWTNASRLPFLILTAATFKLGVAREWRDVSVFVPASACPLGM